jgi:Protein of unknown function (DUF2892)
MTFINEGQWDRGIRMLAGVLLLSASMSRFVSGGLGVVLVVAGAIALGTGIIGWCPAYKVFGVSTAKIAAGHCPNCEINHRP